MQKAASKRKEEGGRRRQEGREKTKIGKGLQSKRTRKSKILMILRRQGRKAEIQYHNVEMEIEVDGDIVKTWNPTQKCGEKIGKAR